MNTWRHEDAQEICKRMSTVCRTLDLCGLEQWAHRDRLPPQAPIRHLQIVRLRPSPYEGFEGRKECSNRWIDVGGAGKSTFATPDLLSTL